MDLYVQERYADFVQLVAPLLKPIWQEVSKSPIPSNFEEYLERAKTYLRLNPTTATLEPYPEFEEVRKIDWEEILESFPNIPIRELSEVGRSRWNSLSDLIYEVEIDGKIQVYKQATTTDDVMNGINGLKCCRTLKVHAPNILGLIGIDTKWGGYLMTKTQLCYCLSDYPPDTSRAERQRWYDQISEAVHTIHRGGRIWGDAKPDNVLIDINRDACLIHFEGGWTLEWVDDELANKKKQLPQKTNS
jgi:hypothetical protein